VSKQKGKQWPKGVFEYLGSRLRLTTGPQQSMLFWLRPSTNIARSSMPTTLAICLISSRSNVAPKEGPEGKLVGQRVFPLLSTTHFPPFSE
jgi:hypothetical protein